MHRILKLLSSSLEHASNHAAGRPIAGIGMSLAKTVATGEWHWFSYDSRGWWQNRQREATFFSPTIHTSTLGPLTREVDDYWCFQTQVAPGNVVVDVGAGIGDHVLVFARRVGPGGRVVAIEAHPATARCLKLTVDRNRLTNTHVVEEAAWDREGTLQMSDDAAHERNAIHGSGGNITIRARPVDAMLAPLNLPAIDLLKMNIEGAEVPALAGMTTTLARTRAVVISCHDFLANAPDDPRRTKARVIAVLEAAGFTIVTRPDAPLPFVRDYVYGRRDS